MKMSAKGIGLLKQFEGSRLRAYRDGGGVWTIGYGHTAMAGGIAPKSGMTITQQQADDLLANDLVKYENGVKASLTRVPNQNQFDAMVSLCYNIGTGGFRKSSVARLFNDGNMGGAANAFLLWNKDNGKVVSGLTKRRKAEMALFLTGVSIVASKPAPIPAQEPVSAPVDDAGKPSIQKVMMWLIGAVIAAVGAYFGLGGQ
jgi:lysozyme